MAGEYGLPTQPSFGGRSRGSLIAVRHAPAAALHDAECLDGRAGGQDAGPQTVWTGPVANLIQQQPIHAAAAHARGGSLPGGRQPPAPD